MNILLTIYIIGFLFAVWDTSKVEYNLQKKDGKEHTYISDFMVIIFASIWPFVIIGYVLGMPTRLHHKYLDWKTNED